MRQGRRQQDLRRTPLALLTRNERPRGRDRGGEGACRSADARLGCRAGGPLAVGGVGDEREAQPQDRGMPPPRISPPLHLATVATIPRAVMAVSTCSTESTSSS